MVNATVQIYSVGGGGLRTLVKQTGGYILRSGLESGL
jgi:biotin transporter BioY